MWQRARAQTGPRLEVLEAVQRCVGEEVPHPGLVLRVRQVLHGLSEKCGGAQRGGHALGGARLALAQATLGAAVEAVVPLERKLDEAKDLHETGV